MGYILPISHIGKQVGQANINSTPYNDSIVEISIQIGIQNDQIENFVSDIEKLLDRYGL